MRNIIRNILREFDEFGWAKELEPDDYVGKVDWIEKAAEYFTGKRVTYDEDGDEQDESMWEELTDSELKQLEPLLFYAFVKDYFRDVNLINYRVILNVNHWEDLVGLFEDCRGGYNYICRDLAKSILQQDDFWEPYYDVVNDWVDEVWDSISKENIKEVIETIRQSYIENGNSETITLDGEEVELTEELLQIWIGDSDVLGSVINDADEFIDLKMSLTNCYERAYNDASIDEIWNSVHESIIGLIGEGKWNYYDVQKGDGTTRKESELLFDITGIFWDIIEIHFKEYCGYYVSDRTCDFEYSNFLDLLAFFMEEGLYEDQLNPRYQEWPDRDKVGELFNECIDDGLAYM